MNLLCVEQDMDYPCVCWAEKTTPAHDAMDVHYIVAGLFTRGNARNEIYYCTLRTMYLKQVEMGSVRLT